MITVVDHGVGNVGSMLNMLKKIGAPAVSANDPDAIVRADKLILPGVGAFDSAMKTIRDRDLVAPLRAAVERGTPLLGVCLGMHLLTEGSEEGSMPGLGLLPLRMRRFDFSASAQQPRPKVPHMGWAELTDRADHALFDYLPDQTRFYFVHSYYAPDTPTEYCLARCVHGGQRFAAVIGRGNVIGTQFHPEKSHRFGMALLRAFAGMR